MKSSFVAAVCRLLVVALAFVSYQSTAGMIGTDQVALAGAAQGERALISSVLDRTEVARQLQAFGVDATAARDRVAALTDEEARSLAGKLHQVPAGADANGWAIAAIVIVGFLLWWRWR